MNNFRRNCYAPVLALAAVLVFASVASACPSCKSALGDSAEGQRLVRGYFLSICFMVAMPFTVFGGLSGYMYWLVRCARRNGAPQAAVAPVSETHDEPASV
jgi:hypothetical protein